MYNSIRKLRHKGVTCIGKLFNMLIAIGDSYPFMKIIRSDY